MYNNNPLDTCQKYETTVIYNKNPDKCEYLCC